MFADRRGKQLFYSAAVKTGGSMYQGEMFVRTGTLLDFNSNIGV